MKYNQREKIHFTSICRIEEITVSFSEKTKARYAKILSVDGNCFFCFNEKLFQEIMKSAETAISAFHLEGEVTQKKGGTFLNIKKFGIHDHEGIYIEQSEEIPVEPEEREIPPFSWEQR